MLLFKFFAKLLDKKSINCNIKLIISVTALLHLNGLYCGTPITTAIGNRDETLTSSKPTLLPSTSADTAELAQPNFVQYGEQENVKSANESTLANETELESTSFSPEECIVIPHSEPKSASFILIYILICIYSFLGITVTCHHYFVTSMSRICEDFKLSEDIVGATFMAAGSSAPELATVIIAVFFTKNDIGISDVIGSAVFNMLFVIGLCGLFTTTVLQLNWWPLVRNCFFYTVSIMIMLVAIANEQVSWWESLLLIAFYIIYCVALYYNEFLEAWANTLPLPFNKLQNQDIKDMDANYIPLEDRKLSTYATTTERNSILQSNGKVISSIQQTYQSNNLENEKTKKEGPGLTLSPDSGVVEQMKFYFINPVYFVCKKTIPDWQQERFHNLYLLTFGVSFLWISVYSYIMIWMITIIGEILRIPSTVMGLTLVAAGVSVPDAVTSLKVVKEGYADMAVSNAIGSNIFDILICLGVPWFLQTAIIGTGSYAKVYSKGMIYATMLLFSTVILLLTAIHKNGWKLDKKFGIVLMVGYLVFITVAVLYELFGSSTEHGCGFI